MIQKINYGLTITSVVLVAGSIAALLVPNRKNISIVVGALGGASAGLAVQQTDKRREQRVNQALTLIVKTELRSIHQKLDQLNHTESLEDIKGDAQTHSAGETKVGRDTNDSLVLKLEEASTFKEVLQINGFEVLSEHPKKTLDYSFLRNFAYNLGSSYQDLEYFHKSLLNAAKNPTKNIRIEVRDGGRNQLFTICDNLKRKNYLSYVTRHRKSNEVEFSVNEKNDFLFFLEEDWFLRFIDKKIKRWIGSKQHGYGAYSDVKLKLPSGGTVELDFLMSVDKRKFIWIECEATQVYEEHLSRYVEYKQGLMLPPERSLIVMLGLPDQEADKLSAQWNLTVVNEDTVIPALERGIADT